MKAAWQNQKADTSDIPEPDASFFKRAGVRMFAPEDQGTISPDRDVLEWFRALSKG